MQATPAIHLGAIRGGEAVDQSLNSTKAIGEKMKSQFKMKGKIAMLAALCVWSSQAAAVSPNDLYYNCKIFAKDAAGNKYYLRQGYGPNVLYFEKDAVKATRWGFSRKLGWTRAYGVSYYMTGGAGGGCVSWSGSGTLTDGVVVNGNYKCSDVGTSATRISLHAITTTAFAMRDTSNTEYFFSGPLVWGQPVRFAKKSTTTAFGLGQSYYASNCINALNQSVRPSTTP